MRCMEMEGDGAQPMMRAYRWMAWGQLGIPQGHEGSSLRCGSGGKAWARRLDQITSSKLTSSMPCSSALRPRKFFGSASVSVP